MSTDVIIPPYCEMVVPVQVEAPRSMEPHTDFYIGYVEPETRDSMGLVVARTVAPVKDGLTVARLLNPTDHELRMHSGSHLGVLHHVDNSDVFEPTDGVDPDAKPVTLPDLGDCYLTDDQRQKLSELLERHCNVFSTGGGFTKATGVIKHHINTNGSLPVRKRAYRTSPDKRREIDRQVQRLLADGVIEESCSPWQLPIDNDRTGRRCRWGLELDPYDWIIVHKSGVQHTNADALSRCPVSQIFMVSSETQTMDMSTSVAVCGVEASTEAPLSAQASDSCEPSVPPDGSDLQTLFQEGSNVRRLQQEDPDIRSLLEWLRAGERPSSVRIKGAGKALRILWHEFPRMTMIDGIVHRVVALSDVEQTWQVVVPSVLVPEVLRLLHGGPLTGHLAVERTMARARGVCFWPCMYRDIRTWCEQCYACQRRKAPVPHHRAPMRTTLAQRPFQRVTADILELPVTLRGNRYVLVVEDYFTKRLDAAFRQSRDNSVTASDKQRTFYDTRERHRPYEIVDLVWLHDPTESRRKLAPHWKGPYIIERRQDRDDVVGVTYVIGSPFGEEAPKQTIHYDRLRPYCLPSPVPLAGPPRSAALSTQGPVTYDALSSHGEPAVSTPSPVREQVDGEFVPDAAPIGRQVQGSRSGRHSKAPGRYADYVMG
uniref:Gypsy retrotransposon integrase-like protein 1 n=1 Tax=Knipowitschia caucasica TaxID=637954 RepID=A0AAV2J220_KNICA